MNGQRKGVPNSWSCNSKAAGTETCADTGNEQQFRVRLARLPNFFKFKELPQQELLRPFVSESRASKGQKTTAHINISHPANPRILILTKHYGMWGGLPDVFLNFEFQSDRSINLGAVGGRNLPFFHWQGSSLIQQLAAPAQTVTVFTLTFLQHT